MFERDYFREFVNGNPKFDMVGVTIKGTRLKPAAEYEPIDPNLPGFQQIPELTRRNKPEEYQKLKLLTELDHRVKSEELFIPKDPDYCIERSEELDEDDENKSFYLRQAICEYVVEDVQTGINEDLRVTTLLTAILGGDNEMATIWTPQLVTLAISLRNKK